MESGKIILYHSQWQTLAFTDSEVRTELPSVKNTKRTPFSTGFILLSKYLTSELLNKTSSQMATLRKNTKADFEWEQRKGHHFPKNKENGAHSLGLLWQLKVIGRPDFPCGWWKVKDFRDDSSSLLEDTLLASLAWECTAPAGNGQVQTASRRQLSLSFAHLSGSHPPFLPSPLASLCIHNPCCCLRSLVRKSKKEKTLQDT